MQTEKDHQHHIKEVVSKEGRVVVNGVDPGTVDQPETQHNRNKSKSLMSRGSDQCPVLIIFFVLLVQKKYTVHFLRPVSIALPYLLAKNF